tara:strand:- start:2318 stop:4111 length:1794 start_codon:yes stop_codon:yes gene_type:complete
MSIVEKLTEGIVNRDLSAEGAALISKWESTGLLEGLGDDTVRNGMARLLENQAKELLRETSTMQGGDVQGFAAVAFPLVRRVFGNLIANELVSVQPMSLPSGLIFFLDFEFGGDGSSGSRRLGFDNNTSIYGGNVIASQITGGVQLEGLEGTEAQGPYNLRNGYASPTGSLAGLPGVVGSGITILCSGTLGAAGEVSFNNFGQFAVGGAGAAISDFDRNDINSILRFDPDLTSGSAFCIAEFNMAGTQFAAQDATAFETSIASTVAVLVQRLTALSRSTSDRDDTGNGKVLRAVYVSTSGQTAKALSSSVNGSSCRFIEFDDFTAGGAVGSVVGTDFWGLENNVQIPEINIKVDSVAVTAQTKKLKAKWTPELGQDLNAYHNLDAEVELTQILSEQIALEIDREILEDLVVGARAGIRYWSRSPGKFVNRETGAEIGASSTPDFTGNVSEWYETLIETINDVSAQIHRKTLRGAANFIVVGPEVANILEFTAGFRANVTADSDRGDAGAVKVGSLSKKLDIMVDPYFPRNLVLVGRRGSSFLESGYVYAPYVPLQTTPTIFGVEDFVPRKGVMTRYAKKMVRPDMYGLVICSDLVTG